MLICRPSTRVLREVTTTTKTLTQTNSLSKLIELHRILLRTTIRDIVMPGSSKEATSLPSSMAMKSSKPTTRDRLRSISKRLRTMTNSVTQTLTTLETRSRTETTAACQSLSRFQWTWASDSPSSKTWHLSRSTSRTTTTCVSTNCK